MKIKATAKELKNADVRFISLVKRGANRIPFRILKTDKGENQMIDLASLSPVLKGEKTRIIPREEKVLKAANTRSFADILAGSVSRDIGTPPPPVKIAPFNPCKQLQGRNPRVHTHSRAGAKLPGKPSTRRRNRYAPNVATRLNSKTFRPRLIAP